MTRRQQAVLNALREETRLSWTELYRRAEFVAPKALELVLRSLIAMGRVEPLSDHPGNAHYRLTRRP